MPSKRSKYSANCLNSVSRASCNTCLGISVISRRGRRHALRLHRDPRPLRAEVSRCRFPAPSPDLCQRSQQDRERLACRPCLATGVPASREVQYHSDDIHSSIALGATIRLAGQHVPAIYGPSGDVTWEEADPTYSLDAAKRGG
jgi:hypothetical protein